MNLSWLNYSETSHSAMSSIASKSKNSHLKSVSIAKGDEGLSHSEFDTSRHESFPEQFQL